MFQNYLLLRRRIFFLNKNKKCDNTNQKKKQQHLHNHFILLLTFGINNNKKRYRTDRRINGHRRSEKNSFKLYMNENKVKVYTRERDMEKVKGISVAQHQNAVTIWLVVERHVLVKEMR